MKYTVKKGDSLSTIARDILGDVNLWPSIASLNKISEPYVIQVGQVLNLPDTAIASKQVDDQVRRYAMTDPLVRHISPGLTITATAPAASQSGMPSWLKFGLWGLVAAGVSYFLMPPAGGRRFGGVGKRRRVGVRRRAVRRTIRKLARA